MSPRSRPVTIGVFGHYGNENLGDEAIIEASIRNIRKRLPHVHIVCFSLGPVDTATRYGVPAHPIRYTTGNHVSRRAEMESERRMPTSRGERDANPTRQEAVFGRLKAALKTVPIVYPLARFLVSLPRTIRHLGSEIGFLWKSRSLLKGIDLLFFAGSNQFLDNFGGAWGYPYTVLKWTLLARSAGAKVAFVSVGSGPLVGRLSKAMIRAALAFADYQSVRDEQSKVLLRGGKQTRLPLVYPDLAFSLPTNSAEPVSTRLWAGVSKPTVGINMMAIYHERYWHSPDREKYERYVHQIAEFAAFVLREGYPIFLYGNQPYDDLAIGDVIEALVNMGLDRKDVSARVKTSNTVAEYIEVVRQADVVVAVRFHGTVLALHAHRAVLGVCYGPKCVHLLNDMGQEEYVFDLDDFRAEDLQRSFLQLAGSLEAQVQKIKQKHLEYQRALDEQYSNVLKLLA